MADGDVDGVGAFGERVGGDEAEHGEEEDEHEEWVWLDHVDYV